MTPKQNIKNFYKGDHADVAMGPHTKGSLITAKEEVSMYTQPQSILS